jgi:hypothetical protein
VLGAKARRKNTTDLRNEDVKKQIFGSVIEDGQWRIRTNVELEKLYRGVNIGIVIKLLRIGWRGYIQWMDDTGNTKKICQAKVHQKRTKGRSTARWKYIWSIRKMVIVNWRQTAQDRDVWMYGGDPPWIVESQKKRRE